MPAGASGVSPAASARWPDDWIRLSTSRMFSKYSSTVERSCGASSLFKRLAAAITESRMLALALKRAARSSADPMSPNIRSNALCGFISFGRGIVAVCHDKVLRYRQLQPNWHEFDALLMSSMPSSSERNGVSRPIASAMY